MSTYVLTTLAEHDLDQIIFHVAADSPQNARRVYSRFLKAFETLAIMPGMGHPRPDLTPRQLLFWPVHSWLIVYHANRKGIEIVRIVHGARDLRSVLGESIS